jgi:hypothetical protein
MSIIKPSSRRRLRARDSNSGNGSLSSCLLSPVNKRLNFSFDASDAATAATSSHVVMNNNNHVMSRHAERSGANACDPSSSIQFDMDIDHQLALLDESYLRDGGSGNSAAAGGGFDNFSPCRTRSGCVYESGLKKQRFRLRGSAKRVKTERAALANGESERTRICSGQSGTGSIADCSENGSDADENCAPLSKYCKSCRTCTWVNV